MPFGIGGGAFGLRGGISTRGIGVGVGPFSAGTSWRGGRRRSGGDVGFIPFLLMGVVLFLVAAWPYLLGTYAAVEFFGAENPSTARSVVGWACEILYIIGLIASISLWMSKNAERAREKAALAEARAREEARERARLVASGVVFPERHANSTVYRHGGCTINHRSAGTAERCRSKSADSPHNSTTVLSTAPNAVQQQAPAQTSSRVRCYKCQHMQTVPINQATFSCDECGTKLRRRTQPATAS